MSVSGQRLGRQADRRLSGPVPGASAMGGYQFAVAMDILRSRYREEFDKARPLVANAPLAYQFALPSANHVFRPGYRIMVQVQSSWFPLYDRNPQTFVRTSFYRLRQLTKGKPRRSR